MKCRAALRSQSGDLSIAIERPILPEDLVQQMSSQLAPVLWSRKFSFSERDQVDAANFAEAVAEDPGFTIVDHISEFNQQLSDYLTNVLKLLFSNRLNLEKFPLLLPAVGGLASSHSNTRPQTMVDEMPVKTC